GDDVLTHGRTWEGTLAAASVSKGGRVRGPWPLPCARDFWPSRQTFPRRRLTPDSAARCSAGTTPRRGTCFGRYTVGAVASIAFGLAEPLVDGNVARVLCRLYAVPGAPGAKEREARLWAHASRLVPAQRPGDWNQALMELGATLCRTASPSCLLCPVRTECRALAQGEVALLPPPRPAPRRKTLRL